MADISAALTEATQWMDDVPGVVGVGQGDDGGTATVDVWVGPDGPTKDRLPREIHGVPVRIRETGGPIEAQN